MKRTLSISLCFFYIITFSQTFNLRERYNTLAALSVSTLNVGDKIYTIGATSDTSSPLDPMSYIARHNLNGSFDFFKSFKISGYMQTATNENSLVLGKDSTLVCVGYCLDASNVTKVLFLKYDTNGNMLTYKTYTAVNSQRFFGKRITEATDGFYIMGTIQYLNFDVNLFVIKTDTAGNEQWRRFYGSNTTDELSSAFIKTSNNRLVIAGVKSNRLSDTASKSWTYLLMLDTLGNIIRSNVSTDPNSGTPKGIIEAQDGNFVFCTNYAVAKTQWQGTYARGYMAKVDTSLHLLWEKLYGDSSVIDVYPGLNNVTELNDGSLIAVGATYNDTILPYYYQHQNGVVIKTDANGNQIWSREYRGVTRIGQQLEQNILYDSEILSDGSIVACGVAQDDNDTFPQRAWLLRIDDNGCMDNSWCGYTEIEELQQTIVNIMQVYPNPATNQLSVVVDETLISAQLNIYRATGALVYSRQLLNQNTSLNISDFDTGVYIAEVKTKKINIKKKWVKI